jgi:hypothetical protein
MKIEDDFKSDDGWRDESVKAKTSREQGNRVKEVRDKRRKC